jgi:hypothetical protein
MATDPKLRQPPCVCTAGKPNPICEHHGDKPHVDRDSVEWRRRHLGEWPAAKGRAGYPGGPPDRAFWREVSPVPVDHLSTCAGCGVRSYSKTGHWYCQDCEHGADAERARIADALDRIFDASLGENALVHTPSGVRLLTWTIRYGDLDAAVDAATIPEGDL